VNKKEIAARLVRLRGDRTQASVATGIGVSRSALAMYESGKRIPKDEIKAAIAKYYKRSVQFIFFT